MSLWWANFKYFNFEIACILCYFIELEVFYTSQNLSAITDKFGQYASYSLCLRTNGRKESVCECVWERKYMDRYQGDSSGGKVMGRQEGG